MSSTRIDWELINACIMQNKEENPVATSLIGWLLPMPAWGLQLGQIVQNIRQRISYTEHQDDVVLLGIVD